MYIDTDKIVTMTAANQNFSAVARQNDLDDGEYLGLTADGSMCYDELLAWIREHVTPQDVGK